MADSRVTYSGKIAPSGAADTLFKVLEDKQALEQYKSKSAIDTAQRSQLAGQQFDFNKYLEGMKRDYETVQYQRTQADKEAGNVATQKGLYGLMGGMANEGTVDMTPFGEFEPASGTFMPKSFEPKAAPLMKDVLMAHVQEGIKSRYAGQQEQQKEAFAEMQRRFGLATEGDMSVLNAKVAWLEANDPNSPFLSTLHGMQGAYSQQGGIEKKNVFTAVTAADKHISQQQGALDQIKTRAEARKESALELQKMKGDTAMAIANMRLQGDVGKQAYRQLKDLSMAAKRQFDAVSREYNDYSVGISAGAYTGTTMAAVQQHMTSLAQQMEEARQRMIEADNALAEGASYSIQKDSQAVQDMSNKSRLMMMPKYGYAKGNYEKLRPEDKTEFDKTLGTQAPPAVGQGNEAPGSSTIKPEVGGAFAGQSGKGLERGKEAAAGSEVVRKKAQEIYDRTAGINKQREAAKPKVTPRPGSATMPNQWQGFKNEFYDLMRPPKQEGKTLEQKTAEEAAIPAPQSEAPFGYEVPQPLTDNHRQELIDLAKEGQRKLGLGAIPPRPGTVQFNTLKRWITNEYYRRYGKK